MNILIEFIYLLFRFICEDVFSLCLNGLETVAMIPKLKSDYHRFDVEPLRINFEWKWFYVPESVLAGRGVLPVGLAAHILVVVVLVLLTGLFVDVVAPLAGALPHDMHGQGPPSRFNKTERSFSAGPNFIFNEFIRWSSVNSGSPEPSMHWSRKFCKLRMKKKENKMLFVVCWSSRRRILFAKNLKRATLSSSLSQEFFRAGQNGILAQNKLQNRQIFNNVVHSMHVVGILHVRECDLICCC